MVEDILVVEHIQVVEEVDSNFLEEVADYFYFHDIENLFVWNDLVHLFDVEHHHKSVLINGEEVKWYWTYTNDSEQREDGFWYRKEVGYKKIRVPVDAKIGSATTWIPDETIIKDLY